MSAWTRRSALAAWGTAFVLAVGCSADAEASDDGASDGVTGTVPTDHDDPGSTTPPATEPPGSRPDLVGPHIQDLLDGYAEAVTTIVADPSVVRDSASPVVEDFAALFEDSSSFPEESVDAWLGYAERSVTLEPITSEHPTIVANVDGSIRTVDDDDVSFAYCEVQRYILRERGEVTERQQELLVPGTGRAVRVGGVWRLRSLTSSPDMQGCFSGTEGR